MKRIFLFPAAFVALTVAFPALAEGPRIITLQGTPEATLPGAHDGIKYGVKVFRGSGFPDPIVIEAPKTVVEDAPAPVRKKTKKKRKRGW